MLASVLHISNLQFDKVDNEQGEIASISDREVRCFFSSYPAFIFALKQLSLLHRSDKSPIRTP